MTFSKDNCKYIDPNIVAKKLASVLKQLNCADSLAV